MISIYCLINPIDGKPFYVGATKFELRLRLFGHIGYANSCPKNGGNEKNVLILDLIKNGLRPEIKWLHSTDIHGVDYWENYFYTMLSNQGFCLLQRVPKGQYKKLKGKKQEKQQCCKDSSIIIW